jgi:RecJ-like exonuclease
MERYQCNVCGTIYDLELDAVRCHPDINIIHDDSEPTVSAAQLAREAETDTCPSCKGKGYYANEIFEKNYCETCEGTGQV